MCACAQPPNRNVQRPFAVRFVLPSASGLTYTGCTHPCPCRSSETRATWPGGLHRRHRQVVAELHLTDRPGRVLLGIRRTNYTAQSSVPCMSYSISGGNAAVHQAAYGARYAVLPRSRRLSTTLCAPRRYGASESEVALARLTYGIDRGSYHVFYHTPYRCSRYAQLPGNSDATGRS